MVTLSLLNAMTKIFMEYHRSKINLKKKKSAFTCQMTVKLLLVKRKFLSLLKDYTYAFNKKKANEWLHEMRRAMLFME